MTTLALLLLAAAVGHALARAVGLPAPPWLLLAGLVLQGVGAMVVEVRLDSGVLQASLLLGVTVLVFVAGAELNPSRFASQAKGAAWVGAVQFSALAVAGYALGQLADLGPAQSGYLALALASSSTFVVVRLLEKRRQAYEPFGRLVLGVLLLQDVVVVLLVAALARWDLGVHARESGVLRALVLLAAAFGLARTVVPWLLTRLRLDEEAQLVSVLATLFAFVGAAHALELPIVTGAFCAGFAVSPFPVNAVIRGQLSSLADFFVALFYTVTGALLVFPGAGDFGLALAMMASVWILTPLVVVGMAERAGLTARAALESGLLLAQTSELSLVVVLLGQEHGHLSPGLAGAIVLTTAVTMALTPLLATDANVWRLLRWHPDRLRHRGASAAVQGRVMHGHVVILGSGATTEGLVHRLVALGRVVVVVDHDPVVCTRAEAAGALAVRGDASDPDVLRHVRAHEAEVVVSTLRRLSDNVRVLAALPSVRTLVRAFEESEVRAIEAAGGTPIRCFEPAARTFLAWFDDAVSRAQQ